MKPFLIVTGLIKEAQLVGSNVRTIVSGADSARLRELLRNADPSAYSGVISFGLAGGLDPALKPGSLVLGDRAIAPGASFECHQKLLQAIAERLRAADIAFGAGHIAGVDAVLLSPEDKKLFRAKTRAVACDMESHIVGDYALRARLPFAILRAISDPAERALPELASKAIDSTGKINLRLVFSALIRNPRTLKNLMAAGRDSTAAFRALARAGRIFEKI